MNIVNVNLGERSYEIVIGERIISKLSEFIKPRGYTDTGIVTNETILGIYKKLIKSIAEELDAKIFVIPDGEQYKDILWFYYLHGKLLENRFDRSSVLIAFGGGVIGDLTGFVASTYMRGIHYIQVPTTLLAQVDSSVGGKTAVNHPLGKNMIGTFYQPVYVLIDTDFLKTLPKREFLAGIAEVIKYGIIWDEDLFKYLKEYYKEILALDKESLIYIISRSCQIKAEVVSRDEKESGLRAILNYGHTIGHAIETVTGYTKFLHGEAVAAGMYAEALTGRLMGITQEGIPEAIKNTINAFGLSAYVPHDLNPQDLLTAMSLDKKARAKKIRCIIPERIGHVTLKEIEPSSIVKAIEMARQSP